MQHKRYDSARGGLPPRTVIVWTLLFSLVISLIAPFQAAQAASTRLENRQLMIQSAISGQTTDYTFSWRFMSPQAVGSVEFLFCTSPLTDLPCYPPAGLDVSGATLSSQAGETGFSISQQTTNRLVISRTPSTISAGDLSKYVFKGVKNPTNVDAFAVRLQAYGGSNLTGPAGDFGSVRNSVTHEIVIETQVPPMLIFCLAEQVELNCVNSNEVYYHDMGEVTSKNTVTAQSQMAVGTNASAGFVIIAEGASPAAGTNVIAGLEQASTSRPGVNQFGINLVANSAPLVGIDPEGVWGNAQPTSDYGQANRYKYQAGDIVASSPNVSLMRKFTVSYILNASSSLKPGIYTATITFIASGQF